STTRIQTQRLNPEPWKKERLSLRLLYDGPHFDEVTPEVMTDSLVTENEVE
ncbi:hypothetical protein GT037_003915, partial [Alternaria burnsii]